MLRPVIDARTREVIVYDIYVAGKWIGSRSTPKQAADALRWHEWPSSVIGETFLVNSDPDFSSAATTGTSKIASSV